eukprot:TRINITY_DN8541_c0_g1_i1.p1 TRINITY_DN8541_c0_g1~~TRINITY_DN8541_c0_g1_i1.p1  ORF type:complete len:295 (-),score=34.67 TRINITY_DN8541_c0_g1_i1:332-1099(-)
MALCMAAPFCSDVREAIRWIPSLLCDVTSWSHAHPTAGILALGGALIVTSAAPVPGYGALLFASGFVFGFPAFLVTFPATLLGSIIGFSLGRCVMRGRVERLFSTGGKLRELDAGLADGRLWPLLLFRLAPAPFPVATFALSISGISFRRFLLITALSLGKQLIHIAIGRSCESLSEVAAKFHKSDPTGPTPSSAPQATMFLSAAVLTLALSAWCLRPQPPAPKDAFELPALAPDPPPPSPPPAEAPAPVPAVGQ